MAFHNDVFWVHMLPLSCIIREHGMDLHVYADDTQLYCSFNVKSAEEATSTVLRIEQCVHDIQAWMTRVRLKLNEDKIEFLIYFLYLLICSSANF